MKRQRKRHLTALLLALCQTLALAACGGTDKEPDANQLSGTIYVPEFIDIDLDFDYINSACCDGTYVYMVADTHTETEKTDAETGETYTDYSSSTDIYRVSLDGATVEKLPNYEPAYQFASSDEGWSNISSIRTGKDGTLWVSETADVYQFDLPEGFDETKDDKWSYQTNERIELERQLDSTGNEIQRVELGNLAEKLDTDYTQSTIMDNDGNIFVTTDQSVTMLDQNMNPVFSVEGDVWNLILLSDGSVGGRFYDDENSRVVLRTIDKEAKAWGTEYPIHNADRLYNGAGKYLFYYDMGDSLYGYNAEKSEGERLLSWSNADINADNLQFFTFLEDGRIVAMTENWEEDGQSIELAILNETDASTLADKTILTYATMYLDQDIRNKIIEFNKSNDKYRIEIRDYSEYNTEDDQTAGLTKLNTEIIAGNVPDLLCTDGLPIQRYGAKGMLEDLWPYIDNDGEISRETLMSRVFDAASQDGKLYQIVNSFAIHTVIGSREVLGDRMGWTLQELQDALATMPEGCAIFGETDTKSDMLRTIMAQNLDQYVDWEKGECYFDSDAFKSALEFCNSFPAEFDYENANWEEMDSEPVRIANGMQMLQQMSLSSFGDIQMYEAIFGGPKALQTLDIGYDYSSSGGSYTVIVTESGSSSPPEEMDSHTSQRVIPGRYLSYVGYPTEDGSVGSSFMIYGGLAMSSTCKDKEGAWSFMRQVLLPTATEGRHFWTFPTNKADFDKMVEDAMKPEYITGSDWKNVLDENGNPIQESKGGWGWGDLNIDIMATTQEEYDQVMELYNSIDTVFSYDSSLYDIVNELAGSYFNGDRSLEDTVQQIQSRANLYIHEND